MRALAADRGDLGGVRADEERAVAVEVGLALVPVVRILLADPVRTLDVLDEHERAGAHDVLLVPVHVLRQDVGLVDEVPGRGERLQEGSRRPLELEAHRVGVGRLHRLDHRVGGLADACDVGRREDDLVVGGLDVPRRHVAPVVELHALADLEGVGQPVGRHGPALGEVADRLGAGGVVRVDAQQRVVVRRDRMDQPEGLLAVPVVGRHLGGHGEDELAPIVRFLLGRSRGCCEDRAKQHDRQTSLVGAHSTSSSFISTSLPAGSFRTPDLSVLPP